MASDETSLRVFLRMDCCPAFHAIIPVECLPPIASLLALPSRRLIPRVFPHLQGCLMTVRRPAHHGAFRLARWVGRSLASQLRGCSSLRPVWKAIKPGSPVAGVIDGPACRIVQLTIFLSATRAGKIHRSTVFDREWRSPTWCALTVATFTRAAVVDRNRRDALAAQRTSGVSSVLGTTTTPSATAWGFGFIRCGTGRLPHRWNGLHLRILPQQL